MFDSKKLSAYILYLRKNRGITQSRLADILGISPQAVSNWERGESLPDISMLSALSDALGTTTDRLLAAAESFNGEEAPSPTEAAQPAPVQAPVHTFTPSAPPPPTVRQVVIHTEPAEQADKPGWEDVIAFAPFASAETLEELVSGLDPTTDIKIIQQLAPFVSTDYMDQLLTNLLDTEAEVRASDITQLAPFCSGSTLVRLVEERMGTPDHRLVRSLAPFLPSDLVDKLLRKTFGRQ